MSVENSVTFLREHGSVPTAAAITRCQRCGYPLTPGPHGVDWCSVYGTHAAARPRQPRLTGIHPVVRELDGLLDITPKGVYRRAYDARRRLKAVS